MSGAATGQGGAKKKCATNGVDYTEQSNGEWALLLLRYRRNDAQTDVLSHVLERLDLNTLLLCRLLHVHSGAKLTVRVSIVVRLRAQVQRRTGVVLSRRVKSRRVKSRREERKCCDAWCPPRQGSWGTLPNPNAPRLQKNNIRHQREPQQGRPCGWCGRPRIRS